MKKYYVAKQIAPEHQESPMFICGTFENFETWEDISFLGNHDLRERESDHLHNLLDVIDDACNAFYELENNIESSYYDTLEEIILDFFCAPCGGMEKEKAKDHHDEWKEVFTSWPDSRNNEEKEIICHALALMTGKEYDWKTIRGCCQGDWQEIYFPSEEYSKKSLEVLEAEYFNTGMEFSVHEEPVFIHEGEEEKAADLAEEDSFTFSVYCTAWNEEEIKKQLADAIGCDPAEVLYFEFDHYKKLPIYRLACV